MSTTALKAKQKKKTQGSNGSSFDNLEIFLLHLPTTIWYLIFCYAPMFGVVIAFKNYKGAAGGFEAIMKAPWIGLKHFQISLKTSWFA